MMMYSDETVIENTYNKHTALLEDLRDCLEMERASLLRVDVDQLWKLMEKKNALAVEVERTGNEIRHLAEAGFQDSLDNLRSKALQKRPWYRAANARANSLREDIRTRLEENQVYIRESLGFFDELMRIIVQNGKAGKDYQHLQNPQERPGPRIYNREV